MLQLLQDDDVEVRAIAAERAVGYTNTSVVHHQGVAVGDVWSKFSRLLSRQDIIEHILLPRLSMSLFLIWRLRFSFLTPHSLHRVGQLAR